jgi:copper chaperone CopZ
MTCAYAVRGALKKFPGVESVDVSLNKGLATVKLKPGNAVRPQDFWETVRKNGFTPKETRVLVRGEMTNVAQPQLRVTGTDLVLDLKAEPKLLDEAKRHVGNAMTLEGTLMPGKDPKSPVPLEVREIRGDTSK